MSPAGRVTEAFRNDRWLSRLVDLIEAPGELAYDEQVTRSRAIDGFVDACCTRRQNIVARAIE